MPVILFFLFFQNNVSAQGEAEIFTAKNSIYVELGGNTPLYGVHYGRILNQKGKFKISGSAGFSYFQETGGSTTHWTPVIPVEITGLWGKTRHNFEIGVGATFYSSLQTTINPDNNMLQDKVSINALLPFRFGYRYQKPEGGSFFRIGYTPGFNLNLSSNEPALFYPIWGGFSIGKSF